MRSCVILRHVAFEDEGLIGGIIRERGFTLQTVEPWREAPQLAVAQADLAIVLGGPIGVYETEAYPFLIDEIEAVRHRLAAGKPTLGICLGAQLMATALGARVAPGPAKEIGYAPITLTDEGRLSPLTLLDGTSVLHWHGDNLELPAGATRLAFTETCPVQAFAIGRHALGLQFHLETPPERVESWLIGHAVELAKAGIDPRVIRADALVVGHRVNAAGRAVLGHWLDEAFA